jgi:class 3 adenylate cyclase/uncharacterized protein HemY
MMPTATMDAATVSDLLALLRENGWEKGVEGLKKRIDEGCDEQACRTYRYFVGWMAGEKGAVQEAFTQLRELEKAPEWVAWAEVGQAFIEVRLRNDEAVRNLLERAENSCAPEDTILRATIQHCRGAHFVHTNRPDEAMRELRAALAAFGPQHFATGRVLDTIGAVYYAKNNFDAAREFFQLALQHKQAQQDDAGQAVAHGQLGRLFLDVGLFELAQYHFKADLELACHIKDKHGEVQMCGALGRVALAQGNWADAAGWLDRGLMLCDPALTILRGFLHKDRALAYLRAGAIEPAEEQAAEAWQIFKAANGGAGFDEGLAHTDLALGQILRARRQFEGANEALSRALRYFVREGQKAEASRVNLELARAQRAEGVPPVAVKETLHSALDLAESSRRDALVDEIEAELCELDEVAYWRRIYARIRGRNSGGENHALLRGQRETATVMFLDIVGSTAYGREHDPGVVLMTTNQMMAEFEPVFKEHEIQVTDYQGDGFMSIARGENHARRATAAALALIDAVEQFNEPRRILQEYGVAAAKPLQVRVGLATGEVFIGNIGTYEKMSFAAIGTTSNLAARLQSAAEPGLPCISQATYLETRGRFRFAAETGRAVTAKGLEDQQVWDVVGRE